jgi:hypothetical protein
MIKLRQHETIGIYMYVPNSFAEELKEYISDAKLACATKCPKPIIEEKEGFTIFYFGHERIDAIYDIIAHALDGLDELEIEK